MKKALTIGVLLVAVAGMAIASDRQYPQDNATRFRESNDWRELMGVVVKPGVLKPKVVKQPTPLAPQIVVSVSAVRSWGDGSCVITSKPVRVNGKSVEQLAKERKQQENRRKK